jgi:methylglutaconyl-CoA hydratase
MPAAPLQIRRQDGALILTIQREERRNALDLATLQAFGEVFRHHLTGEDRAVVVTGSGSSAFCAGADLKERREMSLDQVRAQLLRYRSDLGWLATCPIPTVAAINGAALGGGLELALLCDLRVAVATATFALPETGLGIIPGAGATQYLPRIVGAAKARELILLGTRIDAAEALRIGLIHRIAGERMAAERMAAERMAAERMAAERMAAERMAAERTVPEGSTAQELGASGLLEDTLRWLEPVTRGAPLAQRAALRALRAADRLDLDAGLEFERGCYEACLTSEDRLEALAAFAEKRRPVFKGR